MDEVPVATPPASSVEAEPVEPTVAIEVVLLLHVPPPESELNVVVAPGHTLNVPVMAAGNGYTVTTFVVVHPVGSV